MKNKIKDLVILFVMSFILIFIVMFLSWILFNNYFIESMTFNKLMSFSWRGSLLIGLILSILIGIGDFIVDKFI